MTSTDNGGAAAAGGASELQRRLRRAIELSNVARVSADLGIARESLLRYLAGVDLQPGTRALIEQKLSALEATEGDGALPR